MEAEGEEAEGRPTQRSLVREEERRREIAAPPRSSLHLLPPSHLRPSSPASPCLPLRAAEGRGRWTSAGAASDPQPRGRGTGRGASTKGAPEARKRERRRSGLHRRLYAPAMPWRPHLGLRRAGPGRPLHWSVSHSRLRLQRRRNRSFPPDLRPARPPSGRRRARTATPRRERATTPPPPPASVPPSRAPCARRWGGGGSRKTWRATG